MVVVEISTMQSRNFEFLGTKRVLLGDVVGFPEHYAHEDPASSLLNRRGFVEHLFVESDERYEARTPISDGLSDLTDAEAFWLTGMRTEPGEGIADYVLLGNDSKPLPIVEAKNTAEDSREGAEQARIYAECPDRECLEEFERGRAGAGSRVGKTIVFNRSS
jgi:hypothetical protein